jgi:hypothetical protein
MIFRISLDGVSQETTARITKLHNVLTMPESGCGFTRIGTSMWEGSVPSLKTAHAIIGMVFHAVTEGEPQVTLDQLFVHFDGSDKPSTSPPVPVPAGVDLAALAGRFGREGYAAGVSPLHEGDPGYSTDLDRDGDGVACER